MTHIHFPEISSPPPKQGICSNPSKSSLTLLQNTKNSLEDSSRSHKALYDTIMSLQLLSLQVLSVQKGHSEVHRGHLQRAQVWPSMAECGSRGSILSQFYRYTIRGYGVPICIQLFYKEIMLIALGEYMASTPRFIPLRTMSNTFDITLQTLKEMDCL